MYDLHQGRNKKKCGALINVYRMKEKYVNSLYNITNIKAYTCQLGMSEMIFYSQQYSCTRGHSINLFINYSNMEQKRNLRQSLAF